MSEPEAWLRGPLPGVDPLLMPAAHALVQASEEIGRVVASLPVRELWAKPGGAASAGFHLRHVAGSIDRLLTYARGEALTPQQFEALRAEGAPSSPPEDAEALARTAQRAIDQALATIRGTPREDLLLPRGVGRAQRPTTVLGLLVHIGEHTQRHTGQLVTTVKIVRALGADAVAGRSDSGAPPVA